MKESPSLLFKENLKEVSQLLTIHARLTGLGRGRRHKVDVLNKSAIIFTCASFEAFIEDLAKSSFDHLIESSTSPTELPLSIKKSIASRLREDRHELRVWDIAGDGWKNYTNSHKEHILSKHINPFNTPKYGNIQSLLRDLVGFNDIDRCFRWKNMTLQNSKKKLTEFVKLRGALAHGEKPAPTVRKIDVKGYLNFLPILSVRLSNELRQHCMEHANKEPWPEVRYNSIK